MTEMTREDIIAMAREAGLEDEVLVPWAYEINMFAALIAAAERERIITANAPEIEKVNAHIKALEDAGAAERKLYTGEPAQQQEPVGWMHWLHGPVRLFLNKDEAQMEHERLNREYPVDVGNRKMRPLVFGDTSPPAQRTWVGLTDEEILIMSRYDLEYAALIGEVQRKLKEKNT